MHLEVYLSLQIIVVLTINEDWKDLSAYGQFLKFLKFLENFVADLS